MPADPHDGPAAVPDDERDAPWWETGATPEPVFTSGRRRQWVLIAAAVLAALFVVFFVWIGTSVGAG